MDYLTEESIIADAEQDEKYYARLAEVIDFIRDDALLGEYGDMTVDKYIAIKQQELNGR